MPKIGLGGDVHARFAILAGLVRHEYWLHGETPEDFDFKADPDTMTLSALKHDGTRCVFTIDEARLLVSDLHSLAVDFYKAHCEGTSRFSRSARRPA
ncbi:MAG TPA: hypothetical protein VGI92_07040 [Gemmatimonadales bacterium]|jgi:hypothetical protein